MYIKKAHTVLHNQKHNQKIFNWYINQMTDYYK